MAKGASARAAARKQRDKWKAKRWYTIRAPRTPWSFRVIGETLAEEPSQLIGRNYEIIQNELDGDFSKMHVKVVFKVTDVLGKGLNIVNKLNGLLNCKDSGAKCHEVESWTLNKGSSKPDSTKKKQNFITKSIDAGTKKTIV